MEGDDAVHRSIRCRRQLSTDSLRSNIDVGGVCSMAKPCNNLMFYLLEI